MRPPVASLTDLVGRILAARRPSTDRALVAIGGCSRAGKSTLASALRDRLTAEGVNTVVLSADRWIVDVRERRPGAGAVGVPGVLARFELDPFIDAVDAILAGATVHPPIYDPISRQRTAACGPDDVSLGEGVLIAEGVVALLAKPLCDRADVRIYVEARDEVRRRRLLEFYVGTKGVPREQAEALLADRELDEVPLVMASSAAADVRYVCDDDPSF